MNELALVGVPFPLALARSERYPVGRRAVVQGLRTSARLAGAPADLPFAEWPRDMRGAPAPVRGWHASWADTSGLALAVVANTPVGVDCEWLARARFEAARTRFAESGELALLGTHERAGVLGLWAAKEALLKLAGVGLADLGRCALVARQSLEELVLRYGAREHVVRVLACGAHVLALATAAPCAFALHLVEPSSV